MNLMALTHQANAAKEATTAITGLVKVLHEDKGREDCDDCQPVLNNYEQGCLLLAVEHLAHYATELTESLEDTLTESSKGGAK